MIKRVCLAEVICGHAVWISNSFIRTIDATLSSFTTPGQSVPGNNGNEEVLCLPQRSSITGASSLDAVFCHLLGVS